MQSHQDLQQLLRLPLLLLVEIPATPWPDHNQQGGLLPISLALTLTHTQAHSGGASERKCVESTHTHARAYTKTRTRTNTNTQWHRCHGSSHRQQTTGRQTATRTDCCRVTVFCVCVSSTSCCFPVCCAFCVTVLVVSVTGVAASSESTIVAALVVITVSHPLVLSHQHKSRKNKLQKKLHLREQTHVRARKDARVLTSNKPAGRG